MGRTDSKNKTPPDKEGNYPQPWSWLIGAKIEIVDFDDNNPDKVTNIGLKTADDDRIIWIRANFTPIQFSHFIFH